MIEEQVTHAWRSGNDTKLRKWIESLPLNEVQARPQLNIFYAWSLFTQGQSQEAEAFLQNAESRFSINNKKANVLSNKKRKYFIGGTEAMRAFMAFYRDDEAAIIGHAKRALENLPPMDTTWAQHGNNCIGGCLSFAG